MAQMVSRVGQAEMRIGVNTSAFGSVEVRTVVHANDVGLTIGSEKGDLRGLLNNEMPAITNGLQQQNLRLSSVNFTQGFASSGNGSGGGDSQQRSFVPTTASSSSGSISSENAGENLADLPPLGIFSGVSGSLSILA
jgi:flagellar hook-length control protein FliK